jgi:hypothetical protein
MEAETVNKAVAFRGFCGTHGRHAITIAGPTIVECAGAAASAIVAPFPEHAAP